MFCAHCYYDLSGQEAPRCPECGRDFNFDDPTSYLSETGGQLSKCRRWIRQHPQRAFAAMIYGFLMYSAFAFLLLPDFSPSSMKGLSTCGSFTTWQLANTRTVMQCWLGYHAEHPSDAIFTHAEAKLLAPPGFSPVTQSLTIKTSAILSYSMNHAWVFAIPALCLLVPGMWLVDKARRRWLRAFIILIVLLLSVCQFREEIRKRLFRESLAYVDDVTFVSGVDLSSANPKPETTIALYDGHRLTRKDQICIAFADGHVEIMTSDEARPLFEAQGVSFPERQD